eukprot:tig00021127_g18799.t1
MSVPHVKLSSAKQIPQFGCVGNSLGTWKSEPGQVKAAVKAAIAAGYRHIDCAAIYMNEKEIGEALAEVFAEGKVKREDLFITSKLWNTCHKTENAFAAVKQTLSDLRLEYLDLYLVHWPASWEFAGLPIAENSWVKHDAQKNIVWEKTTLEETWKSMEAIYYAGLSKSIGVSNYSVALLLDLLSYARVPPAVNQIEMHPYNARADLRSFCASRGIHITAYSPLGSGKTGPLQDPVIAEIAKAHGKSPAQVIVAWVMARGASAIPKSVSAARLQENLGGASLKLGEDELKRIDALDRAMVVCDTREYWGFNMVA